MSGVAGRKPGAARLVAIGVTLLVMLLPFLWLLQMSLKSNDQILEFPPPLIFTPTLSNYSSLWHSTFPASFLNSLLSASFSTALALLLGVPAAYALSRWAGRGKHALGFAILVTRMAPPIAFTIPFFLFYRWIGLLDTVTGLVLVYTSFNLPLTIWMMQPFFDTVPSSLEEAALVDGARTRVVFTKIVLPMVAPGIAATAILCFLYAWNDFFFALILTRTHARTAPVAVVNFMNYEGWEWGKIAAGGSLVMAPVLIFSLAVRRYLVSGLTAGAVKG
ncbi:carbohydrate ABC transporter permease [Bradyrhizobium genosp. L]|uniref:carbohydrate ABC transporter permease n=1 Tax=Bradyrhizobium genosp. L TaxID=83637 RepID=UPI0018A283B9|nr:carbohydrate ABC transporter permease [Bradyrhizobium genosp. L]QPF86571.1 carbohydrate ABC transporter permease [Bradyrhizobium genosp. L]